MTTQATYWKAQLQDKRVLNGGKETLVNCVNVSEVDFRKLLTLQIVHNTFRYLYYAPSNTWYDSNNKPFSMAYPSIFIIDNGNQLIIDWDAANDILCANEIPPQVESQQQP